MENNQTITFLQQLCPGDIILLGSRADITSTLVRWWTGKPFSHGVYYLGGGMIAESVWSGVRKIPWQDTYYPSLYYGTVLRRKPKPTIEQINKIIEYTDKCLGRKYDYLSIIPIMIFVMLSRIGIKSRGFRDYFDLPQYDICSELISDAYKYAGITLVDPKKVNESQIIPSDFADYGIDLEKVCEYTP